MTHRVLVASLLVPLAACSLQTSLTGGSSGPVGPKPNGQAAPTTASTSSDSAPSEPAQPTYASGRDVEGDRHIPGNVDCSGDNRAAYMEKYRESCDPREPIIVGLSVADAKKKIAATNAEIQIKVVEQYEFDKDCKADHVCGFEPRRWYVLEPREMTLRINRKLDIGPPPD